MRGRQHEVESFLSWLDAQNFPLKIFVPGNHDFYFDRKRYSGDPSAIDLEKYSSVVVLKNKGTEAFGLKFYGTPWVKGLDDWAFGWKSDEGRHAEFAAIPPDTDVLITHGPPFGHLDLLYQLRLGDEQLDNRIKELPNLKLHVHGHIHWSYGVEAPPEGVAGLIRVNAAICDESYSVTNAPIEVEL